LAAIDSSTKLAHLFAAGDDAARLDLLVAGNAVPADATVEIAKSVARTFVQAWKAEGEVTQGIADAHEVRQPDHGSVAELEETLRTLAQLASTAADALQSHRGC
jgi:uncharacterized membrane protein YqiK